MRINAKERDKKERRVRRAKKRKGTEAEMVIPPTPTRAIDALIGEKQNGKQGAGPPNPATLEHLVAFYGPHGSYGGPILKPPRTGVLFIGILQHHFLVGKGES